MLGEVMFTMFILPHAAKEDPLSTAAHGLFSYTCAWLGIVAHLRAVFTDPVSLCVFFCLSSHIFVVQIWCII